MNKLLVREHYRNHDLVDRYISSRFTTPLAQVQHQKQVDFVNDIISRHSLANALELAPGPLRVTANIVGLKQGYAMDYSEAMLKSAAERLKNHEANIPWLLQRGDAFCLPFKAGTFDLIFSFRFIRHFQDIERATILSEIWRVLKKDGFLIFDVPNYFTETKIRSKLNPAQLGVYDKLWDRGEIIAEMRKNKFATLNMANNISHYDIQVNISRFHKLKLGALARRLIDRLDRYPSEHPYEWVILCQKE